MQQVKVMMIAVEFICIVAVIMFSFCENFDVTLGHWLRAALTVIFALCAIVCQNLQQRIEWYD